MSGRIFISYSRRTKTTALRIRRDLQLNGITGIFLDLDPEDGLRAGSRWARMLESRVVGSSVFLALVSQPWLKSKWCLKEYGWARRAAEGLLTLGGKGQPRIVPVLLADVTEDDIRASKVRDILDRNCFKLTASFEEAPDAERDDAPASQLRMRQQEARRELWDFLAPELAEQGVTPVRVPFRNQKPYPGLEAFEEADAPVFFGREAEVDACVERLLDLRQNRGRNLVVIQAASGAGKSSVLRAGVLSRLKLAHQEEFYCLPTVRPGKSPIRAKGEGFITSIERGFKPADNYPPDLYNDPTTNPVALFPRLAQHPGVARNDIAAAARDGAPAVEGLLQRLRDLASPDGAFPVGTSTAFTTSDGDGSDDDADTDGSGGSARDRITIVLPIDQAEELFPVEGSSKEHLREARRLRILLADLLQRRNVELLVLMAMRSDSFPRLQADPLLGPLEKEVFDLSPLPVSEYRAVIEGPASRTKIEVDEKLIAALLGDLSRTDDTSLGADPGDDSGPTHPADRTEADEDAAAEASAERSEVQARGRADALPLLAFVLNQLEARRESQEPKVRARLTLELYDDLGRVRGAIQRVVDKALGVPVDLGLLRRTFIPALATVDPLSGQFLRKIGHVSEFPEGGAALAQKLRDKARLLISRDNADEYEVAHEAVLRQWEVLNGWLEDAKGALWSLQEARDAAKLWHDRRQELIRQQGGERSPAVAAHDRRALWQQPRLDPVWDGLDKVGRSRFTEDEPLRSFIRPEFDRLLEELELAELGHDRRAEIGDRLAVLGEREIANERVDFGDLRQGVNVVTPSRVAVWLKERPDDRRRAQLEAWQRLLADAGIAPNEKPQEEDETGVPDLVWCKLPGGSVTVYRNEDALKTWATEEERRQQAGEKGQALPADADPVKLPVADNLWIAKYPITLAQFICFTGTGQNRPDRYKSAGVWQGFASEMNQWFNNRVQEQSTPRNYPAQYLTWYQGVAYCRWLTDVLRRLGAIPAGGTIRLPTEAEWITAATGGDPERRYPWGPDWDPMKASNQDVGGFNRFVATGLYPANRSPAGVMDMSGNVYEWCLNAYDDPTDAALDREVARATKGGAYYTQQAARPFAHALSIHHRYRDNPWGLTGARDDGRSTRIAAGIRPIYEGPAPESVAFAAAG